VKRLENVAGRQELGGACSAYHWGEKFVDLWGGIRNKRTGEPWEQNTMVIAYSATKGLAAMTLAIAQSQGWLDYEDVCAEFAQHGWHSDVERIQEDALYQFAEFVYDAVADAATSQ